MRKVIVTGGRNYSDYVMLADVLNFINPDLVIQGGATGADGLARDWAMQKKKEVLTYDAKWSEHGRAAGPIRNKEMLIKNPSAVVVAFQGGSGTKNCVTQAKGLNMIILNVEQ